jgi:hypothetical protein
MSQKARSRSQETRDKIASANRGRIASLETRARQSVAHMGNQHLLGHVHTQEAKAKMSASRTGKKQSPETVAKRKETITRNKLEGGTIRKKVSDETRAKMSKAQMGKKMSPEAIAKRVASLKANRLKATETVE